MAVSPVLEREVVSPELEIRQGNSKVVESDLIILVLVSILDQAFKHAAGFILLSQFLKRQSLEGYDVSRLIIIVHDTAQLCLAFKSESEFLLSFRRTAFSLIAQPLQIMDFIILTALKLAFSEVMRIDRRDSRQTSHAHQGRQSCHKQ